MRYRNLAIFVVTGIFIWLNLSGCTKQRVISPSPVLASIPARIAIAPVQVSNATIELPSSGRKNIPLKLSKLASKEIEAYIKRNGMFSGVVPLSEETLPSSPSIAELAQAGRETEADLVLLGKVIEFDGKINYGFRPSLVEYIVIELTLYETSSGLRLWHKKEDIDLKKHVPITAWSEERIESEYLSMAVEEGLSTALALLLPALLEDMAEYKPPILEKAKVASEFLVDVDRVPRVVGRTRHNAFAVVIGIEVYRDLPQAEFALRDAKMIREYLIRVMGFPPENIVALFNERATKGDIEGYIGIWLKNNVERDSIVFIYYSGHGAPNPLTGEAFIIPFDGNPAFLEVTALPLKKLYQMLAKLHVQNTIVVMDSCFSGAGGRSVMVKGGRPIAVSVENPVLAAENVMVMSAATGTEISLSYPEKRHGLFTYFFLKGLQGEADFNQDKVITLGELYNYLAPKVKRIARERNMEQTPVLLPDIGLLGNRASLTLGWVKR
jgi:hypothetical protein